MTGIMSEKKSHEVEVMSEVIARLARGFDVNWVMDLGSGKGYLSSSLVLQYGLNVLAMDSSPVNTTSALTRNTKLEKRLQQMKTAEKYQKEGKLVKRGKRKKSKNVLLHKPVLSNDSADGNEHGHGSYIGLTAFITEDTDLLEILKDSLAATKKQDVIDGKKLDTVDNHEGVLNTVENDSKDNNDSSECEMEKREVSNTPLDSKKNEETSLANQNCSPDEHRLGLVGLHTCGNLAASSIRLFISNSKVKFICNVGCCYHLIEEEFYENPFSPKVMPSANAGNNDSLSDKLLEEDQVEDESLSKINRRAEEAEVSSVQQEDTQAAVSFDPLHPSEIPNLSVGFPMSSFLRERKFVLERNTRMLSCQSADRLTEQSYSGLNSLYWRALLQVVLKEKLGDKFNTSQVGRIGSKCKDFNEYLGKALEKLGLDIEVTIEELAEYQRKYINNREKIERFFLLRSTLAPLIEGLILLDRLAFLCEQEDVEAAYLVQLFNPVTSPRCHAVIGVRNK